MTDWPGSFPAQCPPGDAVPSSDTFYRLVDDEPPVTEQDFWSYQQLVEAGLQRPHRSPPDACMAVGVSVFDTEESAARTRRAFGALRKKALAAGSLSDSGVVKQTGKPGHHTWWRPVGDGAWQGFVMLP